MPNDPRLFKKMKTSNKVKAKGPSPEDQLLAMAEDRYWTIVFADPEHPTLFEKFQEDDIFYDRLNAFKNALQTYGPISKNLPDFRHNQGAAKGRVFHGHIHNKNGGTYVLEWAPIDKQRRIIVLLQLGTHENYKFQQTPVSTEACEAILNNEINQSMMKRAAQKIVEAKNKVKRVNDYYRNKEASSCYNH